MTGEIDKSIPIYEQWKQTYPRDTVPWDNLALGYSSTGQHEKALANALEAMRLDPKDRFAYQNLADAYERLGRYDEAKAILDQGRSPAQGGPLNSLSRYDMAFIRGDEAGMQRAMDATKGNTLEPIMFLIKGNGQCALGKVESARQSYSQGRSGSKVWHEGTVHGA